MDLYVCFNLERGGGGGRDLGRRNDNKNKTFPGSVCVVLGDVRVALSGCLVVAINSIGVCCMSTRHCL